MMAETIKLKDFLESIQRTANNNAELLDLFFTIGDEENKIPEDCPYTFIESVEQRGDGEGYETHFIFQRKEDAKYFYYYIYDGRIEFDILQETKLVVKSTWEFETQY